MKRKSRHEQPTTIPAHQPPTNGLAGFLQSSRLLLGGLLLALTILAYLPARHAGFIWDDDDYVTNNPLLSAPDGLKRIWFSLDSPSQYFPLTYTVFRMEHSLWGLNPAGYHWVNILLHAANALLVWTLLKRLQLPGAWLAASIFALHPAQVESVAWITELKNVLSLFFFLLALLAWVEFVADRPKPPWRFYFLALAFYLLALFSKTVVCTFPIVLLLVLWLQGKTINRIRLAQTVPFFVASAAMGLVTMWWERYHQGTQGAGFSLGLTERILVAGHAVWFYAGKLFWPVDLTFSYPRWTINPADPLAYGWLATGLGLCAVIYFGRRFSGRSVEVAVLFFVVTLSPMLGFIMLYTFRYTFVADHYQYIASIGLIALVAGGLTVGFKFIGQRSRLLKPAFCGLLLLTLAVLTWRQCGTYADAETLWKTTIAKNPDSFMAYNNLGNIFFQKARMDEAIVCYNKALLANPHDTEAWNNIGNVMFKTGHADEAATNYQAALAIDPHCAEAHSNLGQILLQKGKLDEAVAEYRLASELNPKNAEASYNLACGLAQMGHLDGAIVYYKKAVDAKPDYAEAHGNLANILFQTGKVDEAITHYQKALETSPDDVGIHYNFGNVLLLKGRANEAIAHYKKALAANPDAAEIHFNLATAFSMTGHPQEAVVHFQKGLEFKNDAGARYNLGLALLRLGRQADAIQQFKEALRLKPGHEAARQQLQALGVTSPE